MKKLVKCWGEIWEKDDKTTEMPWIAIEQLQDKITSVKEFNITVETLEKETKKRKNCTAPGIDGIQNFCWKKLEPARRELKRAFEQVRDKKQLNTSLLVFKKNCAATEKEKSN